MKTQFLITASILLCSIFASAQVTGSVKTEVNKLQSIEVKSSGKTETANDLLANNESGEFHEPHGMLKQGRQNSKAGNSYRGANYGIMKNNIEYETKVNDKGDSVKVFKFETPCGIVCELETDINFIPGQRMIYFDKGKENPAQGRMMMHYNKKNTQRNKLMKNDRNMNNKPLNLNNKDIISFEKETLKDGNEKITIIRKKTE